jgi:NhaP-type Na+/H+ or K+/H+ antiporter
VAPAKLAADAPIQCFDVILALALGLPVEVRGRAEIITVSFAVVAFSVFVQGLTMPAPLWRIGEIAPAHKNENVPHLAEASERASSDA